MRAVQGRASRIAARGANIYGGLIHHWNKSEICSTVEQIAYLKNISLNGRQIISLPQAPTCFGPVLVGKITF
jgi:hypothetical protein